MSPPHSTCTALFALLFFGLGVHAAQTKSKEELEAAADKFAHSYDSDWNKNYPSRLKALAEEIAKTCECDEAVKTALVEATKPIASQMADHWRAVYHSYYLSHYELFSEGSIFWDDYPEMLSGDQCSKGIRAFGEQWETLLKSKLTPEQLKRWQAELQSRRERYDKASGPSLEAALEKVRQEMTKDFEGRHSNIATEAELPKERANVLKAAVDEAVQVGLAIRRAKGLATSKAWADDFMSYREANLTALEKKTSKGYIAGIGAAGKAASKVFDEAVKKLLLPDEQAKIKAQKERLNLRIAKLAKDTAERMLDRQLAQFKIQQTAKIERVCITLKLDEERRKALETRLADAEKKITADWKAAFIVTTTKNIQRQAARGDREAQFKQMEMGRFWFSEEDADAKAMAARQAAWSAVLKSILKPDEQDRWQVIEQQLCDQRSRVIAHMAVAELDRSLLLQPEQRTAFEKLALEAAKPLGALPGNPTDLWQGNLNGALVLLHAIGLPKVESLLDASQKKHLPRLAENCDYQWQRLKAQLTKKP